MQLYLPCFRQVGRIAPGPKRSNLAGVPGSVSEHPYQQQDEQKEECSELNSEPYQQGSQTYQDLDGDAATQVVTGSAPVSAGYAAAGSCPISQ